MKSLREHLEQVERDGISPSRGDTFAIEIGDHCLIESYVVDVVEDGIVIHADDTALKMLSEAGCTTETIRRYGAVGKNRAQGFTYAEGMDEEALAHPQFEAEEDDAEAAHRKIQTPAYLRKAHGSRDPNWKVSAQDLEKAKERSISGPEGLAALKRRMMELAGIRKEDDSDLVDKTLELTPTGPAGGEINEDPTTEEPLPSQNPEADTPIKAPTAQAGDVAARAFDESVTTTHQDPLVTVHDPDGLHTHANLSVVNDIFDIDVDADAVHSGPVRVRSGREDGRPLLIKLSKHHAGEVERGIGEAEYRGRKVPLGKPMKGDVKKKKVYVRKPNGNVVKVEFGDKKMRIKRHIPGRRKNFRARHNCDNPGPRWKARYWSCRAW